MDERSPESRHEIAEDAQVRDVMEKYGMSYNDAKRKLKQTRQEAEEFGPMKEEEK